MRRVEWEEAVGLGCMLVLLVASVVISVGSVVGAIR